MLIEGEISFQDLESPIDGATIYLKVEDVSQADGPSETIAEHILSNVSVWGPGANSIPFSVDAPLASNMRDLNLRIHVDVDGTGRVSVGDYVTVRSYPLTLWDQQQRVTVEVRLVR